MVFQSIDRDGNGKIDRQECPPELLTIMPKFDRWCSHMPVATDMSYWAVGTTTGGGILQSS